MSDQFTVQDPTTQYQKATEEFEQQQPAPGLETEMYPKPDDGAQTYKGSGRLTGRKAVVTGANGGMPTP
ncbi:putative oxidoreductase YghA [compost metagenome]